jgi:surface carbohydrate biosynthesis protein
MMKLNGDAPTVLFPIETLTRELDSKLVMALALTAKGCRAIVGHKEHMKYAAANSSGLVWQGKALFNARHGATSPHLADQLINNKSAIMFLHDEGGMHQVKAWPNHVLKTHRIEFLRKRNVNRVCVWGERQKEVLSSYATELKDVIAVTGSPKFDLCLPEYDWVTAAKVSQLRAKYSPFILVCTRFATAAHSAGQGDPFRRKMNAALWPESLDERALADLWFSKWQRDVHDFADFVVLIKELAFNFPRHTVVVRPHPSESLTFYQLAFASFKRVMVNRDDSVLPWIRAAELVVHSNCTTGIEAVLAGQPVLNLLPECEGRTELDVEVAREAGHVVNSIDDAVAKAGDFLSGQAPAHQWSAHAKTILSNLTIAAIPKVAKETVEVLQEQGIKSSQVTLPRDSKLRNRVRRMVKGSKLSYAESKRGPMDPAYIEATADGYRSRYGQGGKISHLADKYVVIDPA